MPNFKCPKCGEEMCESMKDHWKCIHHGHFNISYLMGRVHVKHEGPFHITLSTKQLNMLVDVSHIGVVDEIITEAMKQGFILPIDQGDYNL